MVVAGHVARELDATSDAIDEGQLDVLMLLLFTQSSVCLSVNALKGRKWDEETNFDKDKDKSKFRNYDDACDRVKIFYKEQHGASLFSLRVTE